MAEARRQPGEALPFDRLAIIGIGLIGSSIALAARRFALARRVVLFDISEEVCREAASLRLGVVVIQMGLKVPA